MWPFKKGTWHKQQEREAGNSHVTLHGATWPCTKPRPQPIISERNSVTWRSNSGSRSGRWLKYDLQPFYILYQTLKRLKKKEKKDKCVKTRASKVQTWMAEKQKKKRLELHRRHNLTRQTSLFNCLFFFNRTIQIKFPNQTYINDSFRFTKV